MSSRSLRVVPLALSCAVLACCVPTARVRAQAVASSLERECQEIAKDVARQMREGAPDHGVCIRDFGFNGPKEAICSGGPGIVKSLMDELNRLNVKIDDRSPICVRGQYDLVRDSETDLPAVRIAYQVQNGNRAPINREPRGVFGDDSIAATLGLTVELPPDEDFKQRGKRIWAAYTKPSFFIAHETRVATDARSPYALEIVVADEPRRVSGQGGQAFVPIAKSETYTIRLYNDSDYDAAVVLKIDGLSVFAFSEFKDPATGRPRFDYLIVPAKSSGTVRGWHRNNNVSYSFKVTEYAESAAAELNQKSDIGMITAIFSAAWPKEGPVPPAEPLESPTRLASRGATATARGPEVSVIYKEVERYRGRTRAPITVRYTK
jgi:hypothetical protein